MKKNYLLIISIFISTFSISQCIHSFNMFDSFGDGWNGNIWSLYDQNGTLAASCTLDTGTEGSCEINLRSISSGNEID